MDAISELCEVNEAGSLLGRVMWRHVRRLRELMHDFKFGCYSVPVLLSEAFVYRAQA